jgi:hypothetical protein
MAEGGRERSAEASAAGDGIGVRHRGYGEPE